MKGILDFNNYVTIFPTELGWIEIEKQYVNYSKIWLTKKHGEIFINNKDFAPNIPEYCLGDLNFRKKYEQENGGYCVKMYQLFSMHSELFYNVKADFPIEGECNVYLKSSIFLHTSYDTRYTHAVIVEPDISILDAQEELLKLEINEKRRNLYMLKKNKNTNH